MKRIIKIIYWHIWISMMRRERREYYSTWHRKQEICFNFNILARTRVYLTDYAFHQPCRNFFVTFTCYTSNERQNENLFQKKYFAWEQKKLWVWKNDDNPLLNSLCEKISFARLKKPLYRLSMDFSFRFSLLINCFKRITCQRLQRDWQGLKNDNLNTKKKKNLWANCDRVIMSH